MNCERADVHEALTSKGFRQDTKARDHDYFFLYVGNKRQAIHTYTSRGKGYRTLGDPLISKMSKQMKLTRKQFMEFVVCDMDGENYISHLQRSGIPLDD